MEKLTIKIAVPSLQELNSLIHEQIYTNVLENVKTILKDIGKEYNIPCQELEEKYLSIIHKEIKPEQSVVKCNALTRVGLQCSRKPAVNGIYCTIHTNKQPYGIVTQPIEPSSITVEEIVKVNYEITLHEGRKCITYEGRLYEYPNSPVVNINELKPIIIS